MPFPFRLGFSTQSFFKRIFPTLHSARPDSVEAKHFALSRKETRSTGSNSFCKARRKPGFESRSGHSKNFGLTRRLTPQSNVRVPHSPQFNVKRHKNIVGEIPYFGVVIHPGNVLFFRNSPFVDVIFLVPSEPILASAQHFWADF